MKTKAKENINKKLLRFERVLSHCENNNLSVEVIGKEIIDFDFLFFQGNFKLTKKQQEHLGAIKNWLQEVA